MPEKPRPPISVVGVAGDDLPKAATRALQDADLIVGGARLLDAFAPAHPVSELCAPDHMGCGQRHTVPDSSALSGRAAPRRMAISADVEALLAAVAAEPGRVCVLASGDPGFFGIVRALAERFGPSALDVHPAASSVSLAFARLGLPWDDAVVVSAHGRPLADAARIASTAAKAAVLTSPAAPPQALGDELLRLGVAHARVAVCSRLGQADEKVGEVDLAGLAAGTWDPLSVVILVDGPAVATEPVLAWGLPDSTFDHRGGMVTKAEVRAVALGKLGLPPAGVLWDVGAGSGSVAVECARLAPALRVIAVERRPNDAARIRTNAAAHPFWTRERVDAGRFPLPERLRGGVEVVEGEAPGVLGTLPDPDRAFVGGGGIPVLDAVMARLRPEGRVVATYAALDRAAAAFSRLGHMVQLGVSRVEALPDGGVRLAAENPVFVAWGPEE